MATVGGTQGMKTKRPHSGRHNCRHSYCPNQYDDVIGAAGWGGIQSGGECVPCLYAHQILHQGQTIEQIEAVPQLMQMFTDLLGKTGWTWQDVKDCYERAKCVPKDQRE
jgi:hypothetical protein